MTLSEKAAYLSGLADGLGLKDETSEQKVLRGAVDLLVAISEKLEQLDGETEKICGELDAIEDDLYYETEDDEEEEPVDDTTGAPAQYELTCPKCGAVTVVDEDTLMSQEIVCSKCGAPFDIEFGESDEDEEK